MLLLPALSVPATGQRLSALQGQEEIDDGYERPLTSTPSTSQNLPGRIAGSAAGVAGQRQTRDQAAVSTQPLTRLSSRIESRIQNRLRNRIDRNYDPMSNATAPFAIAEDRTRTRPRRR
jgi:hypothetical protein